jgi:transposase InsO family protein
MLGIGGRDRYLDHMLIFFKIIAAQIPLAFKSRIALQTENALLRHQVDILRRRAPKRVQISRADRMIIKLFLRLWPRSARFISIVHPKTVVRWHREGFRLYWRWKSRNRSGRPRVSSEIRTLVRKMSSDNPLWGAPRIHGEILKLGFKVSQATVSRHMPRRPPNPDQTWKTFLRNHMDCMAAIDFLVVPTLTFRNLYILVILTHQRRELVHFAVTANPTAEWTARQITEAFPWGDPPRYIVRDNDCIYGHIYCGRLRAMGIHDLPIAPRSPWQNGFVERVIGSLRRECLDHVIVKNEKHLQRVLKSYLVYYNRSRTHLSLNKDSPVSRPLRSNLSGRIVAIPEVGGLHHRYERMAA